MSFNGPEPTDTQFDTVVITRQYDGFADFPLYPLNVVADLNAVLGFFYVHSYPFDVSLAADPTTSPPIQSHHGDTSYYFFETQDLPLFGPLRTLGVPESVIDVVEPFFRVIVELGYDRSIPPWEPTPARLIPPLNPATVAADLVNAIGEGINNAAALIGSPAPLSIPAPATSSAPATETATATSSPQVTRLARRPKRAGDVDGTATQPRRSPTATSTTRRPKPHRRRRSAGTRRTVTEPSQRRRRTTEPSGGIDTPTARVRQRSAARAAPATEAADDRRRSAGGARFARGGQQRTNRSHRGEGRPADNPTAAVGEATATANAPRRNIVSRFDRRPATPRRETRRRRRTADARADAGSNVDAFRTLPMKSPAMYLTGYSPPSHRLGPRDMSFEAKRFRHRAVATHQVPVGNIVAAGPGQQRPQPQQPDVAHSQIRRRLARPPTGRSRPRLRPRHRRPRDRAVSPPEHPSQECPTDSSCPSRNRWSTAARMSGIASSRSPRRALSRAKYTLTSGNSHRLCPPAQEHVADLGQELLSAVTLRSRVAVHQRQAQRRPGMASARSSPDRSAIRSASSISRTAESSGSSTPHGIPAK